MMVALEDEVLIQIAGRVADCLCRDGYAFIEDDKILHLAATLRSFLEQANIGVTVGSEAAEQESAAGHLVLSDFESAAGTVFDLVAANEIKDMLGVSRQRTYQIVSLKDFPDPLAELAAGKVWRRDDVKAWIRRHRPAVYAKLEERELRAHSAPRSHTA